MRRIFCVALQVRVRIHILFLRVFYLLCNREKCCIRFFRFLDILFAVCFHYSSIRNLSVFSSVCVSRESQWNMRATIVFSGVYLACLDSRMWHSALTTAAGKLSFILARSHWGSHAKEHWLLGRESRAKRGCTVNQLHNCQTTPLLRTIVRRISPKLKCTLPFLGRNGLIRVSSLSSNWGMYAVLS